MATLALPSTVTARLQTLVPGVAGDPSAGALSTAPSDGFAALLNQLDANPAQPFAAEVPSSVQTLPQDGVQGPGQAGVIAAAVLAPIPSPDPARPSKASSKSLMPSGTQTPDANPSDTAAPAMPDLASNAASTPTLPIPAQQADLVMVMASGPLAADALPGSVTTGASASAAPSPIEGSLTANASAPTRATSVTAGSPPSDTSSPAADADVASPAPDATMPTPPIGSLPSPSVATRQSPSSSRLVAGAAGTSMARLTSSTDTASAPEMTGDGTAVLATSSGPGHAGPAPPAIGSVTSLIATGATALPASMPAASAAVPSPAAPNQLESASPPAAKAADARSAAQAPTMGASARAEPVPSATTNSTEAPLANASAATVVSASSSAAAPPPSQAQAAAPAQALVPASTQVSAQASGRTTPPVASQVAQALIEPVKVVMTAPPQGSASQPHVTTIQIAPAELGRVEIRIERSNDGPAKIELVADRPETLSRLVHDQSTLHQALDQAGLASNARTIEFSLAPVPTTGDLPSSTLMGGNTTGENGSGSGSQRGGQRYANQAAAFADDTATTTLSTTRTVRSGIDITA